MSTIYKVDYPHLRAWCSMMGSYQYYTDMQIERARKDRAPVDAIYLDNDGKWQTFSDIGREDTKRNIAELVKRYEAKETQVAPGLKVSEV